MFSMELSFIFVNYTQGISFIFQSVFVGKQSSCETAANWIAVVYEARKKEIMKVEENGHFGSK